MTDTRTIAILFKTGPNRWGLRGDPYLWQEMMTYFEHTPWPATTTELKTLIEDAFETLTGHSIETDHFVFIERFNHGGMSSGHISPTFWREKAVPLLLGAFADNTT